MISQDTFFTALKAVSVCMAERDVRYYLNAVNFKFNNDSLELTATDGHCLLHAKIAIKSQEPEIRPPIKTIIKNQPEAGYVIDRKDIKKILKIFTESKRTMVGMRVAFAFSAGKLNIANGYISIAVEDVQSNRCKYPDWRLAIPKKTEEASDTTTLRGSYWSKVGAALGAMTADNFGGVEFYHPGKNEAVKLTISDKTAKLDGLLEAFGIIMCVRM